MKLKWCNWLGTPYYHDDVTIDIIHISELVANSILNYMLTAFGEKKPWSLSKKSLPISLDRASNEGKWWNDWHGIPWQQYMEIHLKWIMTSLTICQMFLVPLAPFTYVAICFWLTCNPVWLKCENPIWYHVPNGASIHQVVRRLIANLVKSRSREIRVSTFPIALKFDRHIGSSATEMPVTFQSDTIITTSNLVTSRLHEIWQYDVLPLSE